MFWEKLGQKLSSRKFWAAIVAFLTSVLAALNIPDLDSNQVIAIVSAVGSLMIYILGESYVDGKRIEADSHHCEN
jgi:hypothetical protein